MAKKYFFEDKEELFETERIKRIKRMNEPKKTNLAKHFFIPPILKSHPYNLTNDLKNFHNNAYAPNKLINDKVTKIKQVVVKTIGDMGYSHSKAALNYALNNSDVGFGYDKFGGEVKSSEVWNSWLNDMDYSDKTKSCRHLVFSIDEVLTGNEERDDFLKNTLKNAVECSLLENLNTYEYVYALHTHQNRLHCHVIVNRTNELTGYKMRFRNKDDLRKFNQNMRTSFGTFLNIGTTADTGLIKSKWDDLASVRYEATEHKHRDFYNKKILELEKINNEIQNKVVDPSDIDKIATMKENNKLIDMYSEQYKLNNSKILNLKDREKNLNKEIKKKEIYSFNIKRKILEFILKSNIKPDDADLLEEYTNFRDVLMKANNDNKLIREIKPSVFKYYFDRYNIKYQPTFLLKQLDTLTNEIDDLKLDIENNNATIDKKLTKLKTLSGFIAGAKHEFENISDNVTLFHKQQQAIENFEYIKKQQHLGKSEYKKFIELQSAIELQKPFLDNALSQYLVSFDSNPALKDNKTSCFELVKMIKNLKMLSASVDKDNFDMNNEYVKDRQYTSKLELQKDLIDKIARVNAMLMNRYEFMNTRIQEMHDKTYKMLKDGVVDANVFLNKANSKECKLFLRNLKHIDYMFREIKTGNPHVVAFLESVKQDEKSNEIFKKFDSSYKFKKNYRDLSNIIDKLNADYKAILNKTNPTKSNVASIDSAPSIDHTPSISPAPTNNQNQTINNKNNKIYNR